MFTYLDFQLSDKFDRDILFDYEANTKDNIEVNLLTRYEFTRYFLINNTRLTEKERSMYDKKNNILHFRTSEREVALIRKLADSLRLKPSELIRNIILNQLEKEGLLEVKRLK